MARGVAESMHDTRYFPPTETSLSNFHNIARWCWRFKRNRVGTGCHPFGSESPGVSPPDGAALFSAKKCAKRLLLAEGMVVYFVSRRCHAEHFRSRTHLWRGPSTWCPAATYRLQHSVVHASIPFSSPVEVVKFSGCGDTGANYWRAKIHSTRNREGVNPVCSRRSGVDVFAIEPDKTRPARCAPLTGGCCRRPLPVRRSGAGASGLPRGARPGAG